jgi:ketosteroid isomerase-like protein
VSDEKIELVRTATSALARGDVAAMEAICHEDVELDWSQRLMDPEVVRGREGLRQFFHAMREIFDEIAFEEDEIVDYGEEVLVVSTARFRGRMSGAEVRARGANIWTIRDGKLQRFRFYQSKEDALAALESQGIDASVGQPLLS